MQIVKNTTILFDPRSPASTASNKKKYGTTLSELCHISMFN